MSIISNIQGTLTQTQLTQQLQQQMGDQGRVQQNVGELQNQMEQDERQNSVNEQENVDLAQLSDRDEEAQKRKNKNKKKTLEQQEQPKNQAFHEGSYMLGGGLINTQA